MIKHKIVQKRKLRKAWQNNRTHISKAAFNKAAKALKEILTDLKHESTGRYLKELKPNGATKYTLMKGYKKTPTSPAPHMTNQNEQW